MLTICAVCACVGMCVCVCAGLCACGMSWLLSFVLCACVASIKLEAYVEPASLCSPLFLSLTPLPSFYALLSQTISASDTTTTHTHRNTNTGTCVIVVRACVFKQLASKL